MMMKDKAGSPQQGEDQRGPPGQRRGGAVFDKLSTLFTSEHLWGAGGGGVEGASLTLFTLLKTMQTLLIREEPPDFRGVIMAPAPPTAALFWERGCFHSSFRLNRLSPDRPVHPKISAFLTLVTFNRGQILPFSTLKSLTLRGRMGGGALTAI